MQKKGMKAEHKSMKISYDGAQEFADEINKQFPDTINIIIWDNAPFHKSKILHSNGTLLLTGQKTKTKLLSLLKELPTIVSLMLLSLFR